MAALALRRPANPARTGWPRLPGASRKRRRRTRDGEFGNAEDRSWSGDAGEIWLMNLDPVGSEIRKTRRASWYRRPKCTTICAQYCQVSTKIASRQIQVRGMILACGVRRIRLRSVSESSSASRSARAACSIAGRAVISCRGLSLHPQFHQPGSVAGRLFKNTMRRFWGRQVAVQCAVVEANCFRSGGSPRW